MRPVRLTIQAFGPYAGREVIDFRSAIESGLFGIYGQTGSGKSTIFSAMTFALFGQPAKSDQEAPSLRSDHADADTPTEVEFVFDVGEKRYVVLRRPDQSRPKQRGEGETRSSHEAFLFDASGMAPENIGDAARGTIIAEKKVRDVDVAIFEMLGYGPDQFRQIVLLPQGQFETFLSAKTRERLDILRDLFDVSLYRTLTARLKADAESAERHVRDERELCARRISVEGFESSDALAAGIVQAGTNYEAAREQERIAQAISEAAHAAYEEGQKLEAGFKAMEDARKALSGLQANKAAIDALAVQVTRAEQVRSLLDPEARLAEAVREVCEAEGALRQAREKVLLAENNAASAAETLKREEDRSGEVEELRRQVDQLERFEHILEKAADITKKVETAKRDERLATEELEEALSRLDELVTGQRDQSDALETARLTEARRQTFSARLDTLKLTVLAAENFENTERAVSIARDQVKALSSAHEIANGSAARSLAFFEEAERSLSMAQALHLASKLEASQPCPVCGATEHPSPAAGTVEQAGLDQAFREAKTAWQCSSQAEREAAEKLAGARSLLEEREQQLGGLNRLEETSAELKVRVEKGRKMLHDLGPETDIGDAEAEIEQLGEAAEALNEDCEALRGALSERQTAVTSSQVRLQEILTEVPEPLRNRDILTITKGRSSQALSVRRSARATAEIAAKETREETLVAGSQRQASENVLTSARERHLTADQVFQSRLKQAGMRIEDCHALKPFIKTIEDDRARVADHRRKLENAEEVAVKAADAVGEKRRPDLPEIDEKRQETRKLLAQATEVRSAASHRLVQLEKLEKELAEILSKLDEAEATSGSLRKLAALVNGDNPQKLDLETFAIGAMFDRVLDAANLRLAPMTANRYRLERDMEAGRGRRGLGIQVFDMFTGKARSTTTLSGGETFIAALALALGLADIVESASGKVRLDTIFIDEGFGSLDSENGSGTLDQVLQALGALVSRNRAVGLISHVPLVQEAVPNGFYVRKHHAGSRVEVRSAADANL